MYGLKVRFNFLLITFKAFPGYRRLIGGIREEEEEEEAKAVYSRGSGLGQDKG